jgi:hypothetical protein
MTDAEFRRLVAAAGGRPTNIRPTPGERFVEFIRFLHVAGACAIESARLKWRDIDLTPEKPANLYNALLIRATQAQAQRSS